MVVSRWGEPRATTDVDATVLALLRRKFPSRDADPAHRAEVGRLALLTASNGVKLDVSFAAFPFEREVLERATPWSILPDRAVATCSAEDLVIYKLVAARPLDLVDVANIVYRQGRGLDAARIRRWGSIFAEIAIRFAD